MINRDTDRGSTRRPAQKKTNEMKHFFFCGGGGMSLHGGKSNVRHISMNINRIVFGPNMRKKKALFIVGR